MLQENERKDPCKLVYSYEWVNSPHRSRLLLKIASIFKTWPTLNCRIALQPLILPQQLTYPFCSPRHLHFKILSNCF